MNWKSICILMILAFVFNSTYAINFDEFTIIVDQLDEDISEITYLIVLSNNGQETINLVLAKEPEGLNVYDKEDSTNIEHELLGSNLSINVDFKESEQKTIVIKTFIQNLEKTKDDEQILTLKQDIPKNVSKFEFIIHLPEGAIVSDVEDSSLIFPEPTNILSDGKRIIFDWSVEKPDKSFEVFLDYTIVKSNENTNYLIPISLIFTITIISAI